MLLHKKMVIEALSDTAPITCVTVQYIKDIDDKISCTYSNSLSHMRSAFCAAEFPD